MNNKKQGLNVRLIGLSLAAVGTAALLFANSQGPAQVEQTPPRIISGVLPSELTTPPRIIYGVLPSELNEASGVTPLVGLVNDQFMFIGDANLSENPLSIAIIEDATKSFNDGDFTGHIKNIGAGLQSSLKVNDIEDVAWDEKTKTAFVLVSGSKNSDNEPNKKREKLVKLTFDVQKNQWTGKTVDDFKNKIADAFPQLLKPSIEINSGDGGIKGTFNMEGLAYLPDGRLLFGFRSPTHPKDPAHPADPGDAIVITLKNPHAIGDKNFVPIFEEKPQYLKLDGQGIRGFFYDDELKGCWIVSGESANSKAADVETWNLWFWNMKEPPVKRTINRDELKLKNAEGVCRMNFYGQPGLLLLEDAGKDATKNPFPCRYALIPLPR